MQCTWRGGRGGHHITPVDKGMSLHIPTLSPAHQHMHNMRADMLALKLMLCLRSLLSASPAHAVAILVSLIKDVLCDRMWFGETVHGEILQGV